MDSLRASLEAGEFVCSAELMLGRDHATSEVQAFLDEAARQPEGIRFLSLTDLPGGNPALPPESFAAAVLERGLVPIAHLSGKDVNRAYLEGRLHHLARLGVRDLLALTGDAQKDGFQGPGKPVHDLDSVQILWLIREFQKGISYQLGTRSVRLAPYEFFAGAVVNPFKVREPDLMMQLYKMELKIAAGARFLITQVEYDLRKLYELKQYMVRVGLDHIPVLANVYVPTAAIARMMQSGELAGCLMPPDLLRRLETEKKPQRLERAALMVAAARGLGFAGAHIGGFGLTHRDIAGIVDRSMEIGAGWRSRLDELTFESVGQFYLFPKRPDGLSDGGGSIQNALERPRPSWVQPAVGARPPALYRRRFRRRAFFPKASGQRRRLLEGLPVPGRARPLRLVPEGILRLHELRRLHPGLSQLRRLLGQRLLQAAPQRPLRRFPPRWLLRSPPRSPLPLEPCL